MPDPSVTQFSTLSSDPNSWSDSQGNFQKYPFLQLFFGKSAKKVFIVTVFSVVFHVGGDGGFPTKTGSFASISYSCCVWWSNQRVWPTS